MADLDKLSGSTYAAAKRLLEDTLDGMGVIRGTPCEVTNITDVDGTHTVTLQWTSSSGAVRQAQIVIQDGTDGSDGRNGIDGAKGDKGEKGDQGVQGIQGERGPQGLQGVQGMKGDKGDKGDDGYPFLIYKQYDDISDFDESDFSDEGLMFMVMTAVTGQGYPVYRYTTENDPPYSLVTYLANEGIKGEKGEKGEKGDTGATGTAGQDGTTYIPEVGTVTTLQPDQNATVSVQTNATTGKATFNFGIPKGEKGDGNGKTNVYYPAGSVLFANLPVLSTERVGAVYDILNNFTSTVDFTDGGGKSYPEGSDVAIVNVGTEAAPVLKYNVLDGFVDLDPIYSELDNREPLIFFGTMEQWNALTEEQKAQYRTLKIPDGIKDITSQIIANPSTISQNALQVENTRAFIDGHTVCVELSGNIIGTSDYLFSGLPKPTGTVSYHFMARATRNNAFAIQPVLINQSGQFKLSGSNTAEVGDEIIMMVTYITKE